jgi:hypothetical protein
LDANNVALPELAVVTPVSLLYEAPLVEYAGTTKIIATSAAVATISITVRVLAERLPLA